MKYRIEKKKLNKVTHEIAAKINEFVVKNFPVKEGFKVYNVKTENGPRTAIVYKGKDGKEGDNLGIPVPAYNIVSDSFFNAPKYICENLIILKAEDEQIK